MTITDHYDAPGPYPTPQAPMCQRCGSPNTTPYGAGHLSCQSCDHVQPTTSSTPIPQ